MHICEMEFVDSEYRLCVPIMKKMEIHEQRTGSKTMGWRTINEVKKSERTNLNENVFIFDGNTEQSCDPKTQYSTYTTVCNWIGW